ncbi:putative B3 domain-containing protein [Tanacetum coccineum]
MQEPDNHFQINIVIDFQKLDLTKFGVKDATGDLMAEEITTNSYEDARKQQLLENKKRFEELGILKISRNLSDLSKSEKKSKQREVKPKIRNAEIVEPRRSTRARNPIISYQDEVDIGLPNVRRRSKFDASWTSYIARPLEECRLASYGKRVQAIKSAEKLQSNLQSDYPSFVKSMLRSHVYSCFWLSTVNIVLEDENGDEFEALFISSRTGLSAGWRAFALEHKIDDGDALVFELIEQRRFKVYIVKASMARKKRKTTLDSPTENEKTPVKLKKQSSQRRKPQLQKVTVKTKTQRSQR